MKQILKDVAFWIAILGGIALAVHMYTHSDQELPPCQPGTINSLTTNCEVY